MRTVTLTEDEIQGFETLHPTFTDEFGVSRMLFTEDRRIVFTSEPWTANTSKERYAEIIAHFVTFMAYHEVAELQHNFSPANAGWHHRELRRTNLHMAADRHQAWAVSYFQDEALEVFELASN